MVATGPDDPSDGTTTSPRRSVSESHLCDMNEETNVSPHQPVSGQKSSHSRRHEFTSPLTLPRFVSLRKKKKFRYVNIDNQVSQNHAENGGELTVTTSKKKSFFSKFVGRMSRNISIFNVPNSASSPVITPVVNGSKRPTPPISPDEADHPREVSNNRATNRRHSKRFSSKRRISASAHDIRQIAASIAQPYRISANFSPSASESKKVKDEVKVVLNHKECDNKSRESVQTTQRTTTKHYKTPGLAGIRNHGNTCFMSAVIQCLSHTDILAEYFVTDHYKIDLQRHYKLQNRRNSGTRGELTEQLALLFKSLWLCQYTPEVSANFISTVSKYGSQYRGGNQHDAQEFLLWLLDKVHEDLNMATKKRYKRPKNSHGRSDETVAAETLANHMRCNNSFVQEIFQAQFRSSLQCPTCRRQSNTFDPFRCISIPIPQRQMCTILITVIFMSSSSLHPPKQVKLGVRVSISATIKELREALSLKTGVPKSQFVLTKLNSNGCFHDFNDNQHIADIQNEKSVYAIETSVSNNKQETEQLTLIWFNCKGADNLRFGYIYAHLISREAKFNEIQELLIESMSNEITIDNLNQGLPLKIQVLDGASRKCYLASDVDHPLYMPMIDKALGMFELEGTGPKHLKLIISWPDEELASKIIDLSSGHIDVDDSVKDLECNEDKPTSVTLNDCFQLYTQEEKLGPENAWMCPYCQKLQQGVKKLSLWSLPDILVIHLKRFRQNSSQHTKLDTLVDFPMTSLEMAPNTVYRNNNNNYHHHNNNHQNQLTYWSPWKRHKNFLNKPNDSTYDLYAVCNHHGDIQSGHYTAVCKNPVDHKWYSFNDTKLTCVNDWKDVITSSAYLLFYRRKTMVSLSGALTNSSSTSSCNSSSTTANDHWIYRFPSPKYTPPKVTKSEDNLLEIDSDSGLKKKKSSNSNGNLFHRGTRAYASMAPIASKAKDMLKIDNEPDHHSDDEISSASSVPKKPDVLVVRSVENGEPTTNEKHSLKNKEVSSKEPSLTPPQLVPYSIVESCV